MLSLRVPRGLQSLSIRTGRYCHRRPGYPDFAALRAPTVCEAATAAPGPTCVGEDGKRTERETPAGGVHPLGISVVSGKDAREPDLVPP